MQAASPTDRDDEKGDDEEEYEGEEEEEEEEEKKTISRLPVARELSPANWGIRKMTPSFSFSKERNDFIFWRRKKKLLISPGDVLFFFPWWIIFMDTNSFVWEELFVYPFVYLLYVFLLKKKLVKNLDGSSGLCKKALQALPLEKKTTQKMTNDN